jgi:ribosomal protein S27AE
MAFGGISPGFWGPEPQTSGWRVSAANQAARDAASKARDAEYSTDLVERRLDKLALINMALWSLMSEKLGLTEEDLMERVKKIDLMDGVEDGKLKRTVAQCPACNRVMSPRHTKCIYCGAERLKMTAFDEVI